MNDMRAKGLALTASTSAPTISNVAPAQSGTQWPGPKRVLAAIPWRLVRDVSGLWLLSRLILAAFTYFSRIFQEAATGPWMPWTLHDLLWSWGRWDGLIYMSIATGGYAQPIDAAFFPLYPLLIRSGTLVVGANHALPVALAVSNASLLAACIGLVLMARGEGLDDSAGKRVVLVLLASPLAFFLAAAYTEGIFLALTVWVLLCARRGWWWAAAPLAFFAALSRPTGMIVVLPLAYEYARQHGWLRRTGWRGGVARGALVRGAAVVLAAPAGLAVWCVYCKHHYGHALMWLHVEQAYWLRVSMPPWEALWRGATYLKTLNPLQYYFAKQMVDVLPLLAVLVLTVVLAARRALRVSDVLYLAGLLVLAIDAPAINDAAHPYVTFMSAGRFMLPAIPLWLWLGRKAARSPGWEMALLYGGTTLQAAFLAYFLVNGYIM